MRQCLGLLQPMPVTTAATNDRSLHSERCVLVFLLELKDIVELGFAYKSSVTHKRARVNLIYFVLHSIHFDVASVKQFERKLRKLKRTVMS